MAETRIAAKFTADNSELLAKARETRSALTGLVSSFKGSVAGLSGVWTTFSKMGMAVQAAQMVYQVAEAIIELSKQAGKIDTVKVAFSNLSSSFGQDSNKILTSMSNAARGTVSNMDIMESASLAMQLMGKDVIKYLPQMTKVAAAAARTQGKDVNEMLNDLVVASGRRSVLILDNLGISSATAAKYQEEYARKLGKTREDLDDTQKSQAFFYAVMKAGGEVLDRTGSKALTFGEKLQVLESRASNVKQGFLEGITPALSELAGKMITSSEGAEEFGQVVGTALGNVIRIVSALIHVASGIKSAFLYPIEAIRNLSFTKPFDDIKKSIESAIQSIKSMESLSKSTTFSDMWKGATVHLKEYHTNAKNLGKFKKKFKKQEEKDYTKMLELMHQYELASYAKSYAEYAKFLGDKRTATEDYNVLKREMDNAALIASYDGMAKERKYSESLMRAKIGFASQEFEGAKMISEQGQILMKSKNKKIFLAGQALAISNAVISAAEATMKGFSYGPFIGIPYAALVATALGVQISRIASQKPPEYAVGTWNVPETGPAILHKGEIVLPKTISDSLRTGDGGGGLTINVHGNVIDSQGLLNIVNDGMVQLQRRTGGKFMSKGSVYA